MIIGITGSFGSGKTTVAKMFAELGAYVIDADKLYHFLIKRGKRSYKKIIQHFGKTILRKDGGIDRQKLSQIVFKESSKLRLLERLVHPEVIKEIKRIIRFKKERIIVIDAALLIESGFYKNVDKIILVTNKIKEQVKRAKQAKVMAEKEIRKRIRTQMPLRRKQAFADFIIDNSGTRTRTLLQVKKIWKQMGA